jgi:protein-L-isoaspartate O-methyltransferase
MRTRVLGVIAVMGLALTNLTAAQHPQPEPQATGGNHQRHMEHRFDDLAHDAWQMPARVLETLNVQPGQLVANVCAGTGYFSVRLARSTGASTVSAVDVEPSMVEWVRDRADDEGLDNVVAVLGASDGTTSTSPSTSCSSSTCITTYPTAWPISRS